MFLYWKFNSAGMYTVQIEKSKDEVHFFCGSKDKKLEIV